MSRVETHLTSRNIKGNPLLTTSLLIFYKFMIVVNLIGRKRGASFTKTTDLSAMPPPIPTSVRNHIHSINNILLDYASDMWT